MKIILQVPRQENKLQKILIDFVPKMVYLSKPDSFRTVSFVACGCVLTTDYFIYCKSRYVCKRLPVVWQWHVFDRGL